MPNKLLDAALAYAARGWCVLPCREKPGERYQNPDGKDIVNEEKTPYIAAGVHGASIDPDQIRAWWTTWPNALIGINAGKSGLFVVDIDKKRVNGLDTFISWDINDSGALHSFTPSGGMHIVFNGRGKSSANAKLGIDTRGEGGYFIVPPSEVLSGTYVGAYVAHDDWSRIPAVIPDGLLEKLFPDTTTQYVRGSFPVGGDGKGQLSRASLMFLVSGAPAGERNATLFKVLADFAGCGYTQIEAEEAVLPVSRRIGLPDEEFNKVLQHAYSKPRSPAIPPDVQRKIAETGKKENIAKKITPEEQKSIEKVLLGSMILDNSLIVTVQDNIRGFDDFTNLNCRVIYQAIIRLSAKSLRVDFLTVSDEISKVTDKVKLDDISTMTEPVDREVALTYASIIREKAGFRRLDAMLSDKSRYVKQNTSLSDAVGLIEKDVAQIALEAGARTTSVLNAAQAMDEASELTRRVKDGEISMLQTGFAEHDNNIGGLFPQEFLVCGGRPGSGKSALLLSVINHVSLVKKLPVLLFSLEMSTIETVNRMICQLTGLPYNRVFKGKLSQDEWRQYKDAREKIKDSKIFFDEATGMTVPEIRSKILRIGEREPLALVGIDQLEQMRGYDNLPRYLQMDMICYDFKNLAKDIEIPIWLNHQLSRKVTDRNLKNPEMLMSDLNQAGEKAATQIWLIAHKYDESGTITRSKIKVAKNRFGSTMEFAVTFVGQRMLFSNPVREQDKQIFHSSDDDEIQKEPDWAMKD